MYNYCYTIAILYIQRFVPVVISGVILNDLFVVVKIVYITNFASQIFSDLGIRPLSRAAVTFPAGVKQFRLARRHKFGWRRREAFPAAAGGAP